MGRARLWNSGVYGLQHKPFGRGCGDDEMVPCCALAKHPCSAAERAKGGRTGGERKITSTLRPQRINNDLELSSDNLYDHPHNLEENLLNNKSAGWFSDEHTIRSHSALEVSGSVAYVQQTSHPRRLDFTPSRMVAHLPLAFGLGRPRRRG